MIVNCIFSCFFPWRFPSIAWTWETLAPCLYHWQFQNQFLCRHCPNHSYLLLSWLHMSTSLQYWWSRTSPFRRATSRLTNIPRNCSISLMLPTSLQAHTAYLEWVDGNCLHSCSHTFFSTLKNCVPCRIQCLWTLPLSCTIVEANLDLVASWTFCWMMKGLMMKDSMTVSSNPCPKLRACLHQLYQG